MHDTEQVLFADSDLLLYRPISRPSKFLFEQDDITNIEDW